MKRISFCIICFLALTAFGPVNGPKHIFNSEGEVVLEVARQKATVRLYISAEDLRQYDHLVIERSTGSNKSFTACQFVQISGATLDDINYIETADPVLLTSNADVYYRVKVTSPENITRVFPAVKLNLM